MIVIFLLFGDKITMTYEELLEELQNLSPNQLKSEVKVYDTLDKMYLPIIHFLPTQNPIMEL